MTVIKAYTLELIKMMLKYVASFQYAFGYVIMKIVYSNNIYFHFGISIFYSNEFLHFKNLDSLRMNGFNVLLLFLNTNVQRILKRVEVCVIFHVTFNEYG